MIALGLDLGEKRIGVALSDAQARTARPLTVILHETKDKDLVRVEVLAAQFHAEVVVIGLPLNMDGRPGLGAQRAKRFAARLRHRVEADVQLWDERLTTFEADQQMVEAGMSVARRREMRDAVAAAVILQDYLDAHRGARVMKRRRRKATRFRRLVVLSLITALAAYAYWALGLAGGRHAQPAGGREAGAGSARGRGLFQREGVIRSHLAFLALAYLTRKAGHLQAGTYEFPARFSGAEVLDAMYRGKCRPYVWLTIPEGFTDRQIAEAAARLGLGSERQFLALSPGSVPAFVPLPRTGFEGYLFPDTYRVRHGAPCGEIAAQMLRRFHDVVWSGLFHEHGSYQGRSVNDIIILASLVEAEAKRDDERAVIAGVLTNRLRRGERLECDATIQYALGKDRKQRLFYKDLEIESEYNTYKHAGLPPGPICNPGKASLAAAMNPAAVPYLYYVARPDGSHCFSRTLAEHVAAKQQLKAQRQGARP